MDSMRFLTIILSMRFLSNLRRCAGIAVFACSLDSGICFTIGCQLESKEINTAGYALATAALIAPLWLTNAVNYILGASIRVRQSRSKQVFRQYFLLLIVLFIATMVLIVVQKRTK